MPRGNKTQLKEALKPHQQVVKKNYLVQFLNNQGIVQTVKITDSTLQYLNKKDERTRGIKGWYWNVQDVSSEEMFILNLGESGKPGFIWIAYKSNETNPPDLKQIIDDNGWTPDQKSNGSLSQIVVTGLEEHQMEDDNSTDMEQEISLKNILSNQRIIGFIDTGSLAALETSINLLINKFKVVTSQKRKGFQTRTKLNDLLMEKGKITELATQIKNDIAIANTENNQETVTLILDTIDNAHDKMNRIISPMEEELSQDNPSPRRVTFGDTSNIEKPTDEDQQAGDMRTPGQEDDQARESTHLTLQEDITQFHIEDPPNGFEVYEDASTTEHELARWKEMARDMEEQLTDLEAENMNLKNKIKKLEENIKIESIQRKQDEHIKSKELEKEKTKVKGLEAEIQRIKHQSKDQNENTDVQKTTLSSTNSKYKGYIEKIIGKKIDGLICIEKEIDKKMEGINQQKNENQDLKRMVHNLEIALELEKADGKLTKTAMETKEEELVALKYKIESLEASKKNMGDNDTSQIENEQDLRQSLQKVSKMINQLRSKNKEAQEMQGKHCKAVVEDNIKQTKTGDSDQAIENNPVTEDEKTIDCISTILGINVTNKSDGVQTETPKSRAKETVATLFGSHEDMSSKTVNQVQSPDINQDNETEIKFRIQDSSDVRSFQVKHHYLVEKDIEGLSTDDIRNFLSNDMKKSYRSAECEIMNTKIMLRNIVRKHSNSISTELVRAVKVEMDNCDEAITQISQTYKSIQEEAKKRNITMAKEKPIEVSEGKNSIQPFNGNTLPYHVFEFLQMVDDLMSNANIPFDEGGKTIKSLCEGKALRVIEDNFPLTCNPNHEEIRTVLKRHFGNKELIMKQITSEHKKIGQIPDSSTDTAIAKDIYNKAHRHVQLLLKAELLRNGNQSSGDERGVDEYTLVVADLLPNAERKAFWRLDEDQYTKDEAFEIVLGHFKAVKREIQRQVIRRGDDNPDPNKGKFPKSNPGTFVANGQTMEEHPFTKREARDGECSICEHLKIHLEIQKPLSREHLYYKNGPQALPESCPYIVDLPIMEKRRFIDYYKICVRCLKRSVTKDHEPATCTLIDRVNYLKCAEENCRARYSLCPEHRMRNLSKLKQTECSYAEENIIFNY